MLGRIGQIRDLRESEGKSARENMWTIPMVTVEDEGRLMPMVTVDDEGRKIMEACYGDGNVIKGDWTFGATNPQFE